MISGRFSKPTIAVRRDSQPVAVSQPRASRDWPRRLLFWSALLTAGWGLFAPNVVRGATQEIPDEPNTDKPILALDTGGHTNAVYKLVVSDYKNELISVGLDKTIRIWDLQTGEPLRVLHPPIGPGTHGCLLSAALSPDSRLLAVGSYRALTPLYDHRIHLIDLDTGKLVRSLKGHSYTIYDVVFSPDGQKLASASHDATLRIWDVSSGDSLQVLKGHTGPVKGAAWSPDGARVVSGGLDKTARIWSLATGTASAVMTGHQDEVSTVDWSPDGKTVATGSFDKAIRLYEPGGKFRYAWPKLPNQVMSLKFSPDSQRLMYSYGSNTVPPVGAAILDMVKGRQLVTYGGHDNSALCCAFTKDGKQAITGDVVSRIRTWDSATGTTRLKLDGRGRTMYSAGWSPDGQAIAWGVGALTETKDVGGPLDRTFCFRNLDFGPPPDKTFVRPRARIGTLSMGHDIGEDPIDQRKVIFVRNGQQVASFKLPDPYDEVRCYTLFPDERAVIGTYRRAYLIDAKTGLLQREMTERGEELWGVAPSPNGRYVLTAGNDQVVRVWNLDEGTLVVALFVADEEWIAWTPAGYYAASLAGESLMGWHVNRGPESLADFYPAAQFHKSFYRPDVIRRLLETGDLKRAVEMADRERNEFTKVIRVADALPADVTIQQPAAARFEQMESQLMVRAAAQPTNNQPVSAMQLVINGRPLGAARPAARPADGKAPGKVEEEWTIDLPAGRYDVGVKAETANSYSLSPSVEVTRPIREGDPLPRLFVLSVGVGPDGSTATAVSKALAAGAPGVFSEFITQVLPGEQATPAAVNAALEKIRSQATLADTTVIYYAGQETLDAAGHYRLSAARGGDSTPAGVWLSDKDLKRDLASIPGRMMVAVDTMRADSQREREASAGFCGSTAAEAGADKLDTAAGDFLRELLSAEYGIVVLRASRRATTGRSASGASAFAQAFTEALAGKADYDRDGMIQLSELARYLQQRVKELSKGQQAPVIERPRGVRSFPLAKPPASNRPQTAPGEK
jgi:WD40 repeat protein